MLEVFNRIFGTRFRSGEFVKKILRRQMEHPELTLEDHRAVIERALEIAWWSGRPDPRVVYGHSALFDRALNEVGVGEGPKPSEDSVMVVYRHWRDERRPGGQMGALTPQRKKVIADRLREGLTTGDLCRAIDGVEMDPWQDRRLHDDLPTIFRDRGQVERFIRFVDEGPPAMVNGRVSIAWIESKARELEAMGL